MKVALTCYKLKSSNDVTILNNGHHLNVLLWYHFFENCGYDVIYISNEDSTGKITSDGRDYNIVSIYDYINNESNLLDAKIDYVFIVGVTDKTLNKVLDKYSIPIIYLMMGNNYVNDLDSIIYKIHDAGPDGTQNQFSQIWISPHFGYSIEYYKIRYGVEDISIGPYMWGDDVVKNKPTRTYNKGDKLIVAICEPNMCYIKNCMIPLCICEKGEKYIDFVRCYCTDNLRNRTGFINFCKNLNIHKNKKAVFNNREPIYEVLNKCNCVISTTQECDLNYLFLECFYFGIPLIHNSQMLQEYGYYYPNLDISKGVEQIEIVFKTHDTKLYIEKHKQLLYKYSINNTYYHEWVKQKLVKSTITEKSKNIQKKCSSNNYQFIVICGNNTRKNMMVQQFALLKQIVNVHYLDASTPSNSEEYLNGYDGSERNRKFICCSRSHIRALEFASTSKYEYSIILEDDVAFYKEKFLNLIEEIIDNWSEYKLHKMVSIGWVPTRNYSTFLNMKSEYNKLKCVPDTKVRYTCVSGMQGYIVKNNDIPYLDYLIQPTFINQYNKITSNPDIVKMLESAHKKQLDTVFDLNLMTIDNYLNIIFNQCIIFPPLMIEQNIPSMLGHNNICDYWVNYFNGHETERDKYRLSIRKNTLDIVDDLVENEKRPLHAQFEQFNNSSKIKCLWLRYIDDKSSWITDTTNLWGPDVEAEYIVDILTDDGNIDNIEFLSVPSNFNVSLLKKADIIAYSSNKYNVDYISKLVDILNPKVLIHLSDEFGERPQYKEIFDKVQLVYRQYKFPNKIEYHDEINDTSIKYLPLGYHSWGKKYIREHSILPNRRKYKWCFSGSIKNERTSQIEHISQITPYFCKNTNAFECTEMFRNSLFAFCPSGNSNIESSRIYEAMYNGCIPIIVGDKEKHNLDYFKNMFEIPLPCYFAYSMDEVFSIIQSTDIDELVKTQEHCLQWVQNIGNKIRGDIVNITN